MASNPSNIEIFPWNDNFDTGITVIDEQHKKLVGLLNVLVGHLAFQSEAPELDLIFAETKAYVEFHFRTEEEIWNSHFEGDAWAKWHHQSHGDFIAEIIKIKETESDKPYDEVLLSIVRFLTHWLARHILDSDKRMAKVVLALPSGISLARAKEAANEEMTGATRVLIETLMTMYDKLADSTVQMSREIHKRQQAEDELMRAKLAAEASSRAKSSFLSHMSHELRTPLNSILGFTDILRRGDSLSGEQKEQINIIHKSGNHLLDVINDILDIAKIEAGQIVLEHAAFDLERMIHDVTDIMGLHAEEKRLQLTVTQSSRFPRYIISDEAKLRQILINLISNAIKASEKGCVSLLLDLTGDNKSTHLIIEVDDNGCGISAEDQAQLFQPFVQVGSLGKQQGTGLGLAITRQFVEVMGGKLSLKSTVGQGSTFRVELPVKLAQPEAILTQAEINTEVRGLTPGQPPYRILVAEDQMDNQMLMLQLLEIAGIKARLAVNGAEAVEQFQNWQPHFIWMDLRMPIMGGEEATQRIRTLAGGKEVKIAAVTASIIRDKEEDKKLLATGFDAIVYKPYRSGQIFECMERLLELRFERTSKAAEPAPSKVLSAKALSNIPAQLRNKLAESLVILDGGHILAVIDEIEQIAPELGTTLKGMARNYNYMPIRKLLENDK